MKNVLRVLEIHVSDSAVHLEAYTTSQELREAKWTLRALSVAYVYWLSEPVYHSCLVQLCYSLF